MKSIHLAINLSDDLATKSVTILHNDTGLVNDSKLLFNIGWAIVKSIVVNKEDCEIQDMLSELGISNPKEK